jgi:hypothetical protein
MGQNGDNGAHLDHLSGKTSLHIGLMGRGASLQKSDKQGESLACR